MRRLDALPLAAVLALLGSALASVNVVDTYAHGLVRGAPRDTIAAALLAAGNHRQSRRIPSQATT